MTDRQFFIFMHENKVSKDVKNIIAHAEKYIFGMPVRLITTEAWNKDIKIQKMLPRDSMLFIDLADYDPKPDTTHNSSRESKPYKVIR